MSTNKTPQYQLHSWTPADSFVRTEFNENFTKLDAALAALSGRFQGIGRIAVGAYTGNGPARVDNSQFVPLPFTPKAVLVERSNGLRSDGMDSTYYGGISVQGHPLNNAFQPGITLQGDGFTAYNYAADDTPTNNDIHVTYHYIAFE